MVLLETKENAMNKSMTHEQMKSEALNLVNDEMLQKYIAAKRVSFDAGAQYINDTLKKLTDEHAIVGYQRGVIADTMREAWYKVREIPKKPKNPISTTRAKLLKKKDLLSPSEIGFITGLKGKRKLTQKQENWLRDIAKKVNVEIVGEFENRLSKKEKFNAVNNCEHEDLGSLGYTHGTYVKCPYCGQMAQVW